MCKYPIVNTTATRAARLFIRMSSPVLQRVEKLLHATYPLCTDPDFLELFRNKRVAVVGNGSNIEWRGSDIDSHDVVIRFNFWVLPEYLNSQNTGTKTTVASLWAMQVIASKDILDAVNAAIEGILFNVWTSGDSSRPSFVLNRFFIRNRYGKSQWKLALIPYELWSKLETSLDWSPPSTGYSTLMILLMYAEFQSLSIYGFEFTANNRIVGNMWQVSHAFNREQQNILTQIEWRENVQFHR